MFLQIDMERGQKIAVSVDWFAPGEKKKKKRSELTGGGRGEN